MRKFYYLFLTLLLGMLGITENVQGKSIKVIFNVDDPANVTINIDGVNQGLVKGNNEITIDAACGYYSTVNVQATTDNFITSVIKGGANQVSSPYNTTWSYYPSDSDAGKIITISTIKGSVARTASCTVNVDNASKVKVMRSGSYSVVQLHDGENTVYYIPGYETMLI